MDTEAEFDAVIFEIYRKQQPALVNSISNLLALGQQPSQIECKIAALHVADEATLAHVRCIAEHLNRIG